MKISQCVAIFLSISGATYGQTLKDAIQKTDNERFVEATADFRKLIALEPTNGTNYFYFGENYYKHGDLDSALVLWKKSFEVSPLNPISIVSNGKASWLKGETEAAKLQFASALKLTKNKNPEVLRNIAATYTYSPVKNLDEAILLLETAVKLDSKNEDGFLILGDALLEKTPSDGSPAIKNYNRVLDINSKSPRGIVRTAKLYQRAQNYELANEKYKEAQAIDPTYAPAYRENAELNMLFKQSNKAIENWKKYLELNNSDDARYRYATSLFTGKQYCEAIPELEGLQTRKFNNFYIERMITYSYYECAKDPESVKKGLDASTRFFALVPSQKVIYLDYKYKGLLLSKSGSDSLAVVELEKASAINDEAAKELAGEIGKLSMKMKKYDKVINVYEFKKSVLKLTAQEQFELGRAYYFGPKNYVLADSSFAQLTRISPTYAPAYLWRARATYPQDPNNAKWLAKPYLQKVIELVKPEERATGGNKAMIIEAAKYLGGYYVTSSEKNMEKAKEYWTIVKQLDPVDKQAKAFFGEK